MSENKKAHTGVSSGTDCELRFLENTFGQCKERRLVDEERDRLRNHETIRVVRDGTKEELKKETNNLKRKNFGDQNTGNSIQYVISPFFVRNMGIPDECLSLWLCSLGVVSTANKNMIYLVGISTKVSFEAKVPLFECESS